MGMPLPMMVVEGHGVDVLNGEESASARADERDAAEADSALASSSLVSEPPGEKNAAHPPVEASASLSAEAPPAAQMTALEPPSPCALATRTVDEKERRATTE